jgi:hypothetical protein
MRNHGHFCSGSVRVKPLPQAAGPIHTIFVLVVLGGWTFYGKSLADSLNPAADPNRLRFYVLTLFFEWLLFVLVVSGVRHSGAHLSALSWEINGVPYAKCSEILESLRRSGLFRQASFLSWAGSCALPLRVVRWISYCRMGAPK